MLKLLSLKFVILLRLLVLSVILFSFSSFAALNSSNNVKLIDDIKEAWDYSLVKPKLSLKILKENEAKLQEASELHKFLYYKTGFWASTYIYDNEQSFHFAKAMLATNDFPNKPRFLSSLINSLAIYFRRVQNYSSSLAASRCTIVYAQTELSLSRVTMSSGISYMLLNDYEKAERLFKTGFEIADRLENQRAMSVLMNNLGVLFLLQGQYQQAEKYFLSSLKINEKAARANGTALNLINLLAVYYLSEDWQNFHRPLDRAKRASNALASEDLKHYFFWLQTAFEIKTQRPIEQYQTLALLERYNKITEPSILKLLVPIAKTLNLELPARKTQTASLSIDLESVFPKCATINSDQESITHLLDKKLLELKSRS